MLRSAAVSLIQEQLGFRTDLESNIITHLQLAQIQLEKGPTKPWFLISEDSYTDTEADEQRLLIPEDFIQEADQCVIRYVPDDADEPSDEVDLRKDFFDVLRTNFAETASGPPQAYALVGNYFRLFPTPDDIYRLHMIYYKKDDVLDTDIENLWLEHAPKLLMGAAGKEIARALRDSAALATFMAWEQEDRLLLFGQNTAREMENMDMQVGGPHV